MADSQPTLNSLAAQITELAETFTRSLKDNNIPAPTFAADSPTSYNNLSADMFLTRQKLIDAITDMWFLTQGPSESVFNYVHNVRNHYSGRRVVGTGRDGRRERCVIGKGAKHSVKTLKSSP